MQGPKADGGDDVVSDINITPLCDIFVVLLIIFMITANAASLQGPKVASLSDNKPDKKSEGKASIEVTIGADKSISLDGRMVAKVNLESEMRAELARTTENVAVIRAHPTLTREDVMEVVGMAEKCDAKISIGTKTKF